MAEITLLEKYFPKQWESLILPSRVKTVLAENKIKTGYRILLYSSPGTGKTTTARLLTTGSEYETMYLSGSNDFTIETIRKKIMPFASGFSVLKKQKCIIIDEAENIRDNLQDSFKIILDKCVNVNFIFITNEVEKMNDAIRSRCTNIDYDFVSTELEEQKKNYLTFFIGVLKTENIKYDKVGLRTLFNLNFPDFRHMLVNLQEIKDAKEDLTEEAVKKLSDCGKQMPELYNLIETPNITAKDLYESVSKFRGKEKDCFMSLGEPFFTYLNDKKQYEKTLECCQVVSSYYDKYTNSMNKFVTLFTCISELRTYFR